MCFFSNVSSGETKNFIENVRKDIVEFYSAEIAQYLDDKEDFFTRFKEYSNSLFNFTQFINQVNDAPEKQQNVFSNIIDDWNFKKCIEKRGIDGNNWASIEKEASRIKRDFTIKFNKFHSKWYKFAPTFLEYIDEIFESLVCEPSEYSETLKIHFPNGVFEEEELRRTGEKYTVSKVRLARQAIRREIRSVTHDQKLDNAINEEEKEKHILNEVAKRLKGDKDFSYAWIIEGRYLTITSDDDKSETNENEKLNEEKSNVINQFKVQIFDLRNKSFSTRQHKFRDFASRFDESLYFENLKEFVRNVFLCELYNENTVLKNFWEKIYPEREIKRFAKPFFYPSYDTDIDFRIKINKEWYKETLIIKKKLTSNFNKLYKTFYKDRWVILENLDEIFDPIINDYKKDGTFQLKENHSEINEKDQENETNGNESNNELEVSSEETNNNNDKDQENETNENENNNTKKDPWFFIIRNAKVEVGV